MSGVLIRPLLFAGFLAFCVAPVLPAQALDPESATAALSDALAARDGATVTHDASEGADGRVTVTNLVADDATGIRNTISLPVLDMEGVAARAGGGFTAAAARFDGGSIKRGSRTITWQSALAENIEIPSAAEVEEGNVIAPFGRLTMGNIVMTGKDDVHLARIDAVNIDMSAPADGAAGMISMQVDGIDMTVDAIGGNRRRAVLKALGYRDLTVSVALDGLIDHVAGTLVMKPLRISIADFGDISVDGLFSGVSLGGLMVSAQRKTARAAAKMDEVTVEFDNTGLVERALDRQANTMGLSRDAFVDQFLGAVPFMLNFIGNPPFQAKLVVIANEFLRDPRSLTIESRPESPVAINELTRMVFRNRSEAPDILALEITANPR